MVQLHSDAAAPEVHTRGRVIHSAGLYDLFANLCTLGRAGAVREHTADLAQLRPGEAVLDVGCGTGELAQRAAARVGVSGRVSGIDPSPEMITVACRKAARRGLAIDYRVAAIEALPFPDAHFDVVLSSLMMHHLPPDLKALGLAEVHRVLKPGGRLFIVDLARPRGRLWFLALPNLIHGGAAYGAHTLPPLLAQAGFTGIDSGPTRFGWLDYVSARLSDPNISEDRPVLS
jgi:ubiquinone/menaquinone biosynthesis C-methylase UbiE